MTDWAWPVPALAMACVLAACGADTGGAAAHPDSAAARPDSAAQAGALQGEAHGPVGQVSAWPLPADAVSAQPDLVLAPSGDLLLSWLQAGADGVHRLRYSRSAAGTVGQWTAPSTIAQGQDWFVNWADTPHLYALPDGSLWAHWLRSTGPARMDYGIDLVRSGDAGRTWSAPQLVHPPGGRGDHGFVTFWPQSRDRLGIAWLDSRQKTAGAGGHDAGHGDGAMMLRAAVYDAGAVQQDEWPLDTSTCDCCTTASAMTERGVVVVYRGRSAGEIRDTRIVRLDGGRWTAPRDVHADGWRIAGCPVNGPVVAARGNGVWVAWYTEAQGVPELRAAYSQDAGDRFGPPVQLAKGPQVLGRVALTLDGDGHPVAAWLEQAGEATQRLVLARYDAQWFAARRQEVATVSARGRASGLPRLQWAHDRAWLVWTDVQDGAPVLRGAQVR